MMDIFEWARLKAIAYREVEWCYERLKEVLNNGSQDEETLAITHLTIALQALFETIKQERE
jgi:hypothetical protein